MMLKLFRTAYCSVKQNMSICLQECNGLHMGIAYRNKTAASLFIEIVSSVNSVEFFPF